MIRTFREGGVCRFAAGILALISGIATAAGQGAAVSPLAPATDISLQNEVRHAIDKGSRWLETNQDTNDFWSTKDHPAITALALVALEGRPGGLKQETEPVAVKKGYVFLMSCVQPDGGIYRKELPSYNTSVSLIALQAGNRPGSQEAILNARKFLIGLQAHFSGPGRADNPLDGGIGYGTGDKRPDLSNTAWALEALSLSKNATRDKSGPEGGGLNWKAAIHFIQSCQNLPGQNSEPWASDDAQNKGGFIYAPGNSKAGEVKLPSGRVALRSYGTMSYAGLVSYIYADLKHDDPRVKAVVEWLRGNYTLEENPGLGREGLFYYYHTMAKALTLYGAGVVETKDGRSINPRINDIMLFLVSIALFF